MLSGQDMIIQADENRTLPCVDPDRRELLLSIGAFVENAVIAAQAAGYSSEVRVIASAPDDRNVVRLTLHRDTPPVLSASRVKDPSNGSNTAFDRKNCRPAT